VLATGQSWQRLLALVTPAGIQGTGLLWVAVRIML